MISSLKALIRLLAVRSPRRGNCVPRGFRQCRSVFNGTNSDFLVKNPDFLLKNVGDIIKQVTWVSKTDDFWIRNEKLRINNEELCIKNDEFCSRTFAHRRVPLTPSGSMRIVNCNINANFFRIFRLKMQKVQRIAPEKWWFLLKNGHSFCKIRGMTALAR